MKASRDNHQPRCYDERGPVSTTPDVVVEPRLQETAPQIGSAGIEQVPGMTRGAAAEMLTGKEGLGRETHPGDVGKEASAVQVIQGALSLSNLARTSHEGDFGQL